MAELRVANDPTGIRGVYLHSEAEIQGTVADHNFMTLMNPSNSGRNMMLSTIAISYSNTNPATEPAPMRGWRITASSGGTLQDVADLAKFSSLMPNATAEVRVNPTSVTYDVPLFNSPAPIDNRSSNVHTVEIPPGATFLLRPGEGIGLRKEADVISAFWNLTIVWAEFF